VTDNASAQPRFILYSTTTCGPCIRLKQRLRELDVPFTEVNVEEDEAAAAWVMSVNGGDRVVPTLLFDDGSWLTNPPVADVLARLTYGEV
jgi:mycoredoxin